MWDLQPINQLLLQVRFPGEVHDVKEFVQPRQFHVQKLIADLRAQGFNVTPELLWDWECRNVTYPLDARGHTNEYHRLDAYAVRPAYTVGFGTHVVPCYTQTVFTEWFDFPYEILSAPKLIADCDGDSILLASLVRGIGSDAYVAIGGFAGESAPLTHAWIVHGGEVWETTMPEGGFSMPEDNDTYVPLLYFNENEIKVAPELFAALAEMDYIPSINALCSSFGFRCDNCRKNALVRRYHLKNLQKASKLSMGVPA